jgi:ComF family protein
LQRLKYGRDIGLGEALSGHLIDLFENTNWNVDCVLPVPLGKYRLSERGYNQAALLAKPLAIGVSILYNPQALSRIRENKSQVDLNYNQRRMNVAGAFMANSDYVKDKRVLVVDDITTSGSTLDACALALCEGGASKVYCLTVARAGFSRRDPQLL